MSSQISSDLGAFHGFIGEQLGNTGANLTPEECLAMWRAEHPSDAEFAQSVAAVQRAFRQAECGEEKPLAAFDEDFRQRHAVQ